jgi:hypothetical protein
LTHGSLGSRCRFCGANYSLFSWQYQAHDPAGKAGIPAAAVTGGDGLVRAPGGAPNSATIAG